MSWSYSNWPTLSGTAQKTAFNLHLQEISDKIDTNMSMAGRSEQTDPLTKYYDSVWERGSKLGLASMRTTGRATSVNVDFADPSISKAAATRVETGVLA